MIENLNRQRVLNLLDEFYAGDVEGALARCGDDIEFFSNAPTDVLPHMGYHRGKAEVRQMWQTVHSRYATLRHDVKSVVAEGDNIAADLRVFFTKRGNGRVVQFDLAIFYGLREGRVVRIREIMDTYDLVQQVLECDLSAMLVGRRADEA